MSSKLISSLADLSGIAVSGNRVLCLFSGGLDGAFILYKLSEMGFSKVFALTVDLGGDLDAAAIQMVCDKLGARSIIKDKKEEFGNDFVKPSIPAVATYLGTHPICASLSRPVMAKVAGEVAGELDCNVILHTSDRLQNSLRRFNGAFASRELRFKGYFGTPFADCSISREEKKAALKAIGIDLFESREFSSDSNFWGREFEYGKLDDPENIAIPEYLYQWTALSDRPAKRLLTITYRNGEPVAVDDAEMDFVELVSHLNLIVGSYGLGRFIGLEEIQNGYKVQEVREMPAAYILFDSYRRLESACVSSECIREKLHIEQLWVREAIEGRWFGPLRAAAQEFIARIAQHVEGQVTYELDLLKLNLKAIKTEESLYIRDRSSFLAEG